MGICLTEIARRLIEWYWTHGCKRQDKYELSSGGWLDRLYAVADSERRLEQAEGMNKSAIGLWGPSQTGKSTSLAYSIDSQAKDDGANSALDWGTPARFSGEIREGGPVVLNPFNGGMDGSGCISEFRLAKEVADPGFPVEIVFADPFQIMHALATGFATECRVDTSSANGQAKTISWDNNSLDTLVQEFASQRPAASRASDPSEEKQRTYEFLRSVMDIFEMLRLGDEERYVPMAVEKLPSFRQRVLQCPALLQNEEAARRFAARLFWNDEEPFNSVYADLSRKLKEVRALFGTETKVMCSLQAAALFLDIASFDKLERRSKNPAEGDRVRNLVSKLGYTRSADEKSILIGTQGTARFLAADRDLALVQGIILKLVIPLKESHLRDNAPAMCQLLERANLLDFPGVSGEGKRARDNMMTPADLLEPANGGKMFTQILKRGKTGSIVASTARQMDIDAFCLLVRGEGHVGSPYQLVNGMNAWWRSLTGTTIHEAKSRLLPISLVVTRWQNLANIAFSSPQALPEAFGVFSNLEKLVDPKVVSILGANIPTYGIEPLSTQADSTKRQKVIDQLKGSALFQEKFREHLGCLDTIFESSDGGCSYLFTHLAHTLTLSPRSGLLARLHVENEEKLSSLFTDAAPGADDPGSRRDAALRDWKSGIEQSLQMAHDNRADEEGNENMDYRDPAQWVGFHLRRFLNVTADNLDPVPMNINSAAPVAVQSYLKRQLRNWTVARQDFAELKAIGINERPHLNLLLECLVAGVSLDQVLRWIRFTVEVQDRGAAAEWRSLLALRLSRALAPEYTPVALHNKVTRETFDQLDQLDEREASWDEDFRNSPHYHRAINPVFNLMERLGKISLKGRERQEGDPEIQRLYTEFQSAAPFSSSAR